MMTENEKGALEKLGGKHWEKNGFDRYYFNTNTDCKVYFDVVKDKWVNAPEDLIAKYEAMVKEAEQMTAESSTAPVVKDGRIYYKGCEVKYEHTLWDGDFINRSFSNEEDAELKNLAYSMQDKDKLMREDVASLVESVCKKWLQFERSYSDSKLKAYVAEKTAEIIKLEDGTIRAMYDTPTEIREEMLGRMRKMKKVLYTISTREEFVEKVAVA